MMDGAVTFLRLAVLFGRTTFGCVNSPYITYRRLSSEKTDSRQTIFIFLLVASYFLFTSLIRSGLRSPFLLTIQFNLLALGSSIGFLGIILLLFLSGKLLGRQTRLQSLFTLWSYSLLPTLLWFFATSMLYVVLPPPRTTALLGKSYSVLFICFSITALVWKVILYYLTVRFGLRIDLFRILIVTLVIAPFIILYTFVMYQNGIFRVPFL